MTPKLIMGFSLITALILGGYYYGEYKAEQVRTEYQILVNHALNEGMEEQKKLQEVANNVAYELEKQKSTNQQKIQNLQERLRQVPVVGAGFNDGADIYIGLLQSAVDSSGLPPSSHPAFIIGEKGAASYTLYAIGEYNECALQVNALIDLVK